MHMDTPRPFTAPAPRPRRARARRWRRALRRSPTRARAAAARRAPGTRAAPRRRTAQSQRSATRVLTRRARGGRGARPGRGVWQGQLQSTGLTLERDLDARAIGVLVRPRRLVADLCLGPLAHAPAWRRRRRRRAPVAGRAGKLQGEHERQGAESPSAAAPRRASRSRVGVRHRPPTRSRLWLRSLKQSR